MPIVLRAVSCIAAALVLTGAAGDDPPASTERLALEAARVSGDRPLYFAGERIEGVPLTAILSRSDTAEYVSFVYGDCTPDDDAGCASPVEIQVWPACRRSLALYGPSPLGPTFERTTLRGVPAAILDVGTRVELQTGRSTIVVFGDSRDRVLSVARALRAVDGSTSVREALPSPVPHALEGTLAC